MKNTFFNLQWKQKEILAGILILICSESYSDSWTQKSPVGGPPRNDAVGFSIPAIGKGYVGTGNQTYFDFWEYDPVSNSWTQKANYPGQGRAGLIGFGIGSKGYAGGGCDFSTSYPDFWEYDPAANVWTPKASFPAGGRSYSFFFTIGSKGYMGTGWDPTWNETADFWEYDPSSNSWTQKANYAAGVNSRGVGIGISTKGYACFGYPNYNSDFWEYDPIANIWTQKANVAGPMHADAVGFSICDEVFIGTGETTNAGNFTNELWEYSPSTNLWTQKASFIGGARDEAVGFSLTGKGYLGTGYFGLTDWYQYTPDSTICNLNVNFTGVNNLCPGTCTNFTNLSFNATSYQWNFFGATPPTSTDVNPQNICYANPGSYDVQLIATNANGSDTLTLSNYITVYPTPPPQGITQSGDTLFAIPGSATYQWYFNTGIINGATGYFYVAQMSGDYNVVATDTNGCEVEAAIFNVIASTQILNNELQFTVYPNPVQDKLFVKCYSLSGSALEISIYNVIGEKILLNVDYRLGTVDCRFLNPGIYYIEINSGEKKFRSKFVKSTYR